MCGSDLSAFLTAPLRLADSITPDFISESPLNIGSKVRKESIRQTEFLAGQKEAKPVAAKPGNPGLKIQSKVNVAERILK